MSPVVQRWEALGGRVTPATEGCPWLRDPPRALSPWPVSLPPAQTESKPLRGQAPRLAVGHFCRVSGCGGRGGRGSAPTAPARLPCEAEAPAPCPCPSLTQPIAT